MKLIFKSLISNAATIDGARKKGKWWIAIILGFISLIIALVPTFVHNITVKGGQYLSGNTQGVDFAIQAFVEEAETKNYKLIVHDAGKNKAKTLEIQNFEKFEYKLPNAEETFTIIKYEDSLTKDTIAELNTAKYDVIVFSKDSIHLRLVTSSSKDVVHTGTWAHAYDKFSNNTDLIQYFGKTYPGTRDNLIKFMDNAFDYQRVRVTWIQTGVMALVDLGVIILMGFMLWILTRGKANPFRMYTILDGFKIVAWAALTPAILTVALAFLLGNLPDIWFPMLLGIRAMWISMKQLRPDGSGYVEQKEVKTVNVK